MGRVHLLSGIVLLSASAGAPALAAGAAAEPFVASGDPAAFDRALECLTQAVYYEARSQSDDGQRAVAQVVLNRVRHPSYPNSVCGVVWQGAERVTGCQFTFTCDGSMNAGIDPYAWDRATRIATAALRGGVYRPVGLALNYHTTAIRPYWAPSLVPQATVGAHIFYRRPGEGGSSEAFVQAPSEQEPDAFVPVYRAPRMERARTERAVRVRYTSAPRMEIPVMEIPVVERPVSYRAQRASSSAASATSRPRQAATPAGPRVTYQGGVRIARGS